MKINKVLAFVASLALAGGAVLATSTAASATQPDIICTESGPGWSDKIDTTGDPATVTVTADEGFLIDAYCVKAGQTKHIITVDPASETVVIDHPEKNSVSHYQYHQIPIPVVVPEKPGDLSGTETRNLDPVCVQPLNGTATVTSEARTWTQTHVLVDNVWVIQEKVYSAWAVTGTTTVDLAICEPENEEPPVILPSCTTVTGAQTIVGTGVISVAGGWDSESIAVPFSGKLKDIGTVLDIQASPLQYVGLHIDTAQGTIVFEEEDSYTGRLWSETSWAGVEPGLGYAALGTIEEFIELNGNVDVTGIRLLYTHPEASSTTVTSFTIGCTVYTFVPPVVVPEKPADIVTTDTEETTDCEADTVTTVTTTTTIGHVLVNNVWVEAEPVVTTASSVRDADDTECPPVVVTPPPVVEQPKPVVPAKVVPAAVSDELAATGGYGPNPWGLIWGALAVVLGIGAVTFAAIRPRKIEA